MVVKMMTFYKEINFKETPIGKAPRDWEVIKLGDQNIAVLIMGQSPPSSTYNKDGEGLLFLQGKAEFGEIYPSPFVYCSKPIKIADTNDVLLSVRAPVGDVNIAPFRCCIGRGLSSIRAKSDKLHYLFLFYYLKFGSKRFESLSMGSTFKAIRKEEIENYKIPLPPPSEQQKIAEVLSTVDEAIQKVDEVIAKTERLKKGLMPELLTKGIGHKEIKQTPVGRIPKEWELVKLQDIGIFQYGITTSAKKEDTGIKFLRITDIKNTGINWSEAPYCELKESELSKYELKLGDVLFARIGATTGKTCYIDQPIKAAFGSYLIRFQPTKKDIDTKFLYFYTQSTTYWLYVNKSKEGQLKKGLNLKSLGNLKLPLPPLSEQRKIAKILSTVDKKLGYDRKEKENLKRIKQGLMDLLLTGKVRVKAD